MFLLTFSKCTYFLIACKEQTDAHMCKRNLTQGSGVTINACSCNDCKNTRIIQACTVYDLC